MKRADDSAAAATGTRPVTTTGEVFADGSMIEMIGGTHDRNVALMLWDRAKETVGTRVKHHGQRYELLPINSTVLRELILPTRCCPHGSTRDLLADICELLANLVGLDEKPASVVGRIVLCTALIDAVSVAPMLTIVGPDSARAYRLMALLRCLGWHSLLLTGVTPAGFCSLPSGLRFTHLISQSTVSDKLRTLLDDASNRDCKIPFRGRLLDNFGVQVIHCKSGQRAGVKARTTGDKLAPILARQDIIRPMPKDVVHISESEAVIRLKSGTGPILI